MPKRKIENMMLQNPHIIAFVFTIMIILSSIRRASMLVYGQVFVDSLVFVILLNTPNAIIEGFGIYQTIQRTLKRKITLKALAGIYLLFFKRKLWK